MALELDYNALHARLLDADKHVELVQYIFRLQGGASRHLNYRDVAAVLHVDRNTVRNYVDDLARKGIITKSFNGKTWELKICEDLIK